MKSNMAGVISNVKVSPWFEFLEATRARLNSRGAVTKCSCTGSPFDAQSETNLALSLIFMKPGSRIAVPPLLTISEAVAQIRRSQRCTLSMIQEKSIGLGRSGPRRA